MRVLRVRLTNYRGVEERAVELAPAGVMVIEGPNEAGKSSLAEAIDFIFEHFDSTTKQEVLATRPVHRDAGAEVEVEVESGPYRFTYFKRFHKRPATTLTVHAPHAESRTGREAHERVSEILAETVDLDLWRALRILQGAGVEQADLSRQSHLSLALDRAAGGSGAGPREESLFELATQEHREYFTEGGKPKKNLEEARSRATAAEAEVQAFDRKLAGLASDVDRAGALDREVALLAADHARLREAERDHRERLGVIELELLRERKGRIGRALADAVKAEQFLAGVRITDGLLTNVEEAHLQLEKARSGLEAASASLEIEALVDITPSIGGAANPLAAGEKRRFTVAELLELTFPGFARVTVRVGAAAALSEKLKVAEGAYAAACRAAGARDADEARSLNGKRQEAARVREEKDRVLKENLGGLTPEALGEKIAALEAALVKIADDEVTRRTEAAGAAARALEATVAESPQRLKAAGLEAIRQLLHDVAQALDRAHSDEVRLEKEKGELRGRLQTLGEEGLAERLAEAGARYERARKDHERMERRAHAAQLLYETVSEERDKVRRSYVAPLKERIEKLGRVVFGPSFSVDLDDELRITSRTVDRVTVPYASLSMGTQEQIAVITRLACAMTVSQDGGVPVILDDALGYSDLGRLERMGAVLALAARDTQVIVLTCMPDRYRSVVGASVVRVG